VYDVYYNFKPKISKDFLETPSDFRHYFHCQFVTKLNTSVFTFAFQNAFAFMQIIFLAICRIFSKNHVISSARKHYSALGLDPGRGVSGKRFRSNVFSSKCSRFIYMCVQRT